MIESTGTWLDAPPGEQYSSPGSSFAMRTPGRFCHFWNRLPPSLILHCTNPIMPLSTENGSRKSTETDAQQSRDMWAQRRSSESGRLSDEAVPLSQMGDVDALIKWNAHD